MYINRRKFIKNIGLVGKTGLFVALSGSVLLKGCAPEAEQETMKEKDQALNDWEPSYFVLEREGLFETRIDEAFSVMEECTLCPRACEVNRLQGKTGFCQTQEKAVIFSHQPHFGEEIPLVGNNGSGTIFFSNCNLRCVFCQNYPLAHKGRGQERSDEELADMMLDLQNRGCHNINLVTPTHVMPNILNATRIAMKKGLKIPLCYNTSGYERAEKIKMLDGVADIYLPDLKFMDGEKAERYNEARARGYPELAQEAIIEMHRQVGDLVTDADGIAKRGLVLRHLVMPNRVAGTKQFVDWVANNLTKDTYVNIMSQYRVEYKAFDYEKIARSITSKEYVEAIAWAEEAGLTNIDPRAMQQYQRHKRRLDEDVEIDTLH